MRFLLPWERVKSYWIVLVRLTYACRWALWRAWHAWAVRHYFGIVPEELTFMLCLKGRLIDRGGRFLYFRVVLRQLHCSCLATIMSKHCANIRIVFQCVRIAFIMLFDWGASNYILEIKRFMNTFLSLRIFHAVTKLIGGSLRAHLACVLVRSDLLSAWLACFIWTMRTIWRSLLMESILWLINTLLNS